MIVRRVEYKVRPGQHIPARRIVGEFVAAIRANEPGTTVYDAFNSAEEPTHFMHMMAFADEPAQKAHQASAHCQKFVKALYPLCYRLPDFTDWQVVAGKAGPLATK